MTAQFDSFEELIDSITPDVYENLKRAVELGRWPDGSRLRPGQLELSLQALIVYEAKHLPEHERSGFVERPQKPERCG